MFYHTVLYKKAFCITGFFFIFLVVASAQQSTRLDSIAHLYTLGTYVGKEKLDVLKELAENYPDPDKKLLYCDALIEAAKAADSTGFLCVAYLQKGNALRLKSDLSKALDNYFKAGAIARAGIQTGGIDIAIADVYSILGDHTNAVSYYQKAIGILKIEKDSVNVATALYNLGDEYVNINKLDSALINTQEAKEIFSKLHYDVGAGYALGSVGMIYSRMGRDKQAKDSLEKAIDLLEKLQEYPAVCEYYLSMSDIYHERGNDSLAKSYVLKSVALAKDFGLKEQVSEAELKLSSLFESAGDYTNALKSYKEYILYRDSVKNIESVEQMADLRTNFEVSRKQVEVDLLNQQKKNQQIIVIATSVALILIAILAVLLYRRYNFIRRTNKIIEEERKRSDTLLLNILPEQTALELKQNGKVKAQRFESVSVLFTDFKGFTSYAENLSPEEVVETVDYYFSTFDNIIEKYGLEKIKTIGDSYMCAGGLPFPSDDHALRVVSAAVEIVAFVKNAQTAGDAKKMPFDIRVGINTGPIVAGVVGSKKFAYDIWGDAVNIASRMESNSLPGRINISENTYTIIKDTFTCEYRGEIDVKNRGAMKMYFVEPGH